MSLGNWSFVRVLLSGIAWIVLVVLFALPRVLSFLTARTREGTGGPAGVSFGPKEMALVLLLTILPPFVLAGLWLWQRGRQGEPPSVPR